MTVRLPVYVQKVADLKPGIELGFWEGWGELEEGGRVWSGARRSASGAVEGCFYGVGFC